MAEAPDPSKASSSSSSSSDPNAMPVVSAEFDGIIRLIQKYMNEPGSSQNTASNRGVQKVVDNLIHFKESLARDVAMLDDSVEKLNGVKMDSDSRAKLLLASSEAYLSASQFKKALKNASEEVLQSPETAVDHELLTHLALHCCIAEANIGLRNRQAVAEIYHKAEELKRYIPADLDKSYTGVYEDLERRLDNIEKFLLMFRSAQAQDSRSQRIGKAGGALELPDGSVNFSRGCLEDLTLFHAVTSVPGTSAPSTMVAVTPILRLNPVTQLINPALVKLVTWHSSKEPAIIRIFQKTSEHAPWSAAQLPPIFHAESESIVFQVNQLCTYCAFMDKEDAKRTEFRVEASMFLESGVKLMINHFTPLCKTIYDHISQSMSRRGCKNVCSKGLTIFVQDNDEIEVTLKDLEDETRRKGEPISKRTKIKVDVSGIVHDHQQFPLPREFVGLVGMVHSVKQYRNDELHRQVTEHGDRINLRPSTRRRHHF